MGKSFGSASFYALDDLEEDIANDDYSASSADNPMMDQHYWMLMAKNSIHNSLRKADTL
jgi:hypothetical protein